MKQFMINTHLTREVNWGKSYELNMSKSDWLQIYANAVSLEVFNFWTHSVVDHHIISSSGISETWCRRYKQLTYLWNTDAPSNDVPSNDLNMCSLTKACVSLTTHTELQQRAPFREILILSTSGSLAETRLAHSLCHLDFPLGPRQQDTEELWPWREERAKHSPSVLSVLWAAGAAPQKSEQNRKYLLEIIS